MKLWSVKVNNWDWNYPRTLYATSREKAEAISDRYPAADRVVYAGNFSDANAKIILVRQEMLFGQLPMDDPGEFLDNECAVLAACFKRYNGEAWNGECYDCDGFSLFPIYGEEDADGCYPIIGWEVR